MTRLIKPFGQRKSRFIPPDEAMRQLEELERREAAEQMERIRKADIRERKDRLFRDMYSSTEKFSIEDLMHQYLFDHIKPDIKNSFPEKNCDNKSLQDLMAEYGNHLPK